MQYLLYLLKRKSTAWICWKHLRILFVTCQITWAVRNQNVNHTPSDFRTCCINEYLPWSVEKYCTKDPLHLCALPSAQHYSLMALTTCVAVMKHSAVPCLKPGGTHCDCLKLKSIETILIKSIHFGLILIINWEVCDTLCNF